MRYVKWTDDDAYRGEGYAFGAWKFNTANMKDDVLLGLDVFRRYAARERDAEKIHSLEEWLRADIVGTLEHKGAFGGTEDLPEDLVSQLSQTASQRRRRWPIARSCGKSFVPDRRNARRCAECRSQAVKSGDGKRSRHR